MAIKKCIVAGCTCTSSTSQNVSFHKFPSRIEFRENWLCAIKSDIKPSLQPSSSHVICSKHFKKDDYQEIKNSLAKKLVLKQGVVPSLFPWSENWLSASTESPESTVVVEKEAGCSAATKTPRSTRSQKEKRRSETDIEKQVEEKVEAIKAECAAQENTVKADQSIETTPAPINAADESTDTKPVVHTVSSTKAKYKSKKSHKHKYRSDSRGSKVKKSHRKALEMRRQQKNQRKLANTTSATSKSHPSSNVTFTPGTKLEAQDFDGKWHEAKIVEVDSDEREVLIHFDKYEKLTDEWIPMDSVRLRPIAHAKKSDTFVVGEKCMARWNDSRKFPATVQKIIKDDLYEVLFNDGYVKVVRDSCMSKVKQPLGYSPAKEAILMPKQEPLPLLDNIVIPDIPRDGEWCCYWVNDSPVGKEGLLEVPHGLLNTIIVEDWRLPEKWTKHLYQRIGNYTGKWDTILVSPEGRKFRSRQELKQYLDENKQIYDSDIYDFCLHKKRAKELGLLTYTDDYKLSFATNMSNSSIIDASNASLMLNNSNNEVYVGALKVKIVDNLYMCPDCEKTFRKENHLQIHIKHYHKESAELLGVCPNMQDLAYLRTAEFGEADLQADIPGKIRKSTPAKSVAASDSTSTTPKCSTSKISAGEEGPKPKRLSESIKKEKTKSLNAALDETSVIKRENLSYQTLETSSSSNTSKKSKFKRESYFSKDDLDSPVVKKIKIQESIGSAAVTDSDDTHFSCTDESLATSYAEEKTEIPAYVNEYGEVIKIVRMRKEEIINCICSYPEADGLMIQCEICLCWQHGICANILKESEVPEKYVCLICKNPERGRPSSRFFHDQDWLYEGKLYTTSYRSTTTKLHDRCRILQDSHALTGNLLELQRFLHSLTIKMNIASNKDHPKMYLWSSKWEKSPHKSDTNTVTKANKNETSILVGLLTNNGNTNTVKLGPNDKEKTNLSVKTETIADGDEKYVPREEAIDPAKCQQVLLGHIQKQQAFAIARLQEIEAKINALDYLDQSNSVENDTEKSERILHRVMQDLEKTQSLAEIFSSMPGVY